MTDQKRDESRDIGVRPNIFPSGAEYQARPWVDVEPVAYGISNYERYVPRSDLAASESRERGARLELNAVHSRADALERQNLRLHTKVAELSARIRELEEQTESLKRDARKCW